VTARVDETRAAIVDGIMRQHHQSMQMRAASPTGAAVGRSSTKRRRSLVLEELERERALYRRDRAA
jgi:hypothetical protein